jgi:hypothetical protein
MKIARHAGILGLLLAPALLATSAIAAELGDIGGGGSSSSGTAGDRGTDGVGSGTDRDGVSADDRDDSLRPQSEIDRNRLDNQQRQDPDADRPALGGNDNTSVGGS